MLMYPNVYGNQQAYRSPNLQRQFQPQRNPGGNWVPRQNNDGYNNNNNGMRRREEPSIAETALHRTMRRGPEEGDRFNNFQRKYPENGKSSFYVTDAGDSYVFRGHDVAPRHSPTYTRGDRNQQPGYHDRDDHRETDRPSRRSLSPPQSRRTYGAAQTPTNFDAPEKQRRFERDRTQQQHFNRGRPNGTRETDQPSRQNTNTRPSDRQRRAPSPRRTPPWPSNTMNDYVIQDVPHEPTTPPPPLPTLPATPSPPAPPREEPPATCEESPTTTRDEPPVVSEEPSVTRKELPTTREEAPVTPAKTVISPMVPMASPVSPSSGKVVPSLTRAEQNMSC
ncbi:hypothetical protein SCHPADRAFT_448763 [Schizopora paradoxa]|uniref:Uncharacterized protein n=1 Tax=Schizopora paradoxa TaxID=27342 RepID=A0A0H2RIM8_9AGAM|nr:hypothetical protein SCHPADRAFT_448763 [Schizopora paradoxa]